MSTDNPTLWGIHMREQVGSRPIEKGYVAIGWPELGDLSAYGGNREEIKLALTRLRPNVKPGAVPVNAGVLVRFAQEIAVGDIVIYPSKADRTINIGRVSGDYQYCVDDLKDYPNRRSVEWLKHYPRNEFRQSALYELGAFISLFRIKNHVNDFLEKIDQTCAPVKLEDIDAEDTDDEAVTEAISERASEVTDDYILRRIHDRLDGYEFEQFVAHILETLGYTCRVTKKSGDGSVDIVAGKDALGLEPPILKVQCKNTTRTIGDPEINQLLGTLGAGELALYVTLGSYSSVAQQQERIKPSLRLIDGKQLVGLIIENYEKLAPRYRTLIPLRRIYVPDPGSD